VRENSKRASYSRCDAGGLIPGEVNYRVVRPSPVDLSLLIYVTCVVAYRLSATATRRRRVPLLEKFVVLDILDLIRAL
jgi:hypothetical protein